MSKEIFTNFIRTVLTAGLTTSEDDEFMYLEQFEENYPEIIRSLTGYVKAEILHENEEDLYESSSLIFEYLIKHGKNYNYKLQALIKMCFKLATNNCILETEISKYSSTFSISKAIIYLLEKGATVKESIFKKIFGNIDKWIKYEENYDPRSGKRLSVKANIFYLFVKHDPEYINKIREYYPFYNLVEAVYYQNVLSDTNMKYPPCIFLLIVIHLLYNLIITICLIFYLCF